MSLLRLAQGRNDLALPAIRRALAEVQDPIGRSRLLPAAVEVTLEAGDVGTTREAADELVEIAAQLDALIRARRRWGWICSVHTSSR